jgi:hypothetical protein
VIPCEVRLEAELLELCHDELGGRIAPDTPDDRG